MKAYLKQQGETVLNTLRELCAIPAPSGCEQARAAYCKEWLEAHGATGVYIDEAKNTVFPYRCENSAPVTVFVAHTDTVFPDTEPLPYEEDETVIRCPGVGDDTASVAVLLSVAEYFAKTQPETNGGVLFVCNSGEEGLGNLKGTRQIFKEYGERITAFVSFDSYIGTVNDDCPGSHRYRVTVTTEGGHSFQDFGKPNAIVELSRIIAALQAIPMPQKEGARTTQNVGSIEGGTSVNTIAQAASMLCEYRSTDWECMEYMREQFAAAFASVERTGVAVSVEMVGDRPCNRTEQEKQERLKARLLPMLEQITGTAWRCSSASTDCNIPLSMGIPALCIGVCSGEGLHTREEFINKASLKTGLEIALITALTLTEKGEKDYV